jgi:hypothetical protein
MSFSDINISSSFWFNKNNRPDEGSPCFITCSKIEYGTDCKLCENGYTTIDYGNKHCLSYCSPLGKYIDVNQKIYVKFPDISELIPQ